MTEPSAGNLGGSVFLQVTGKKKKQMEKALDTAKKLRTFCTDQSFSSKTDDTTKP